MTRDPMTDDCQAACDESACPADLCTCGDWCCTPGEPKRGSRLALRALASVGVWILGRR